MARGRSQTITRLLRATRPLGRNIKTGQYRAGTPSRRSMPAHRQSWAGCIEQSRGSPWSGLFNLPTASVSAAIYVEHFSRYLTGPY
jgi:hypothetical protein